MGNGTFNEHDKGVITVHAAVGGMGMMLQGNRRVYVWPTVDILFPTNAPLPKMNGHQLMLRWQAGEDDPSPNPPNYIYIAAKASPDRPMLVQKIDEHDRLVFQSLVHKWRKVLPMWHLQLQNRAGEKAYYAVDNQSGSVWEAGSFSEELMNIVSLPAHAVASRLEEVRRRNLTRHWNIGAPSTWADRYVATLESIGGPLPWKFQDLEFDPKKAHDDNVRTYLRVLAKLPTDAGTWEALQHHSARDAVSSDLAHIHGKLRRAVIFEIPPSVFGEFYHQADVYLTNHFTKEGWQPAGIPLTEEAKNDIGTYVSKVVSAGEQVPYPQRLPFPICYFAFGSGAAMGYETLLGRGYSEDQARYGGRLLAQVVFEDQAWEIMQIGIEEDPLADILIIPVYANDRWYNPFSLNPWTVNSIVWGILEHKTIIDESRPTVTFGQRRKFDRLAKDLGIKKPVPPPFYPVYLKDGLVEQISQHVISNIKRTVLWNHRWAVIGHDRVRIRRGPLPLDPNFQAIMEKRKYKVFTNTPVDSDVYEMLMKRNLPPKRDTEWLAIRRYWVKDHVKGPEDKPFIPSTRRSKNWQVATEQQQSEDPTDE